MSIIDVAKAAGVSTATVSRVLNGLPGVRPETVAQVRAAVDQLSYKPLRVRVSRKKTPRGTKLKTGNIAVLTLGHDRSWLDRPVLASVISGIQRAAAGADLRLILGEMADLDKPSPLLVDREIDGAILFLSSDIPVAQYEATFKNLQRYVPVVWAMGLSIGVGVDHVTPDNISIGNLAYSYLDRAGCKQFAFLTASANWPLVRLRGQAFLNSVLDSGRRPTVYMVGEDDRYAEAYGRRVVTAPTLAELIQQLAQSSPRTDGLFVPTDYTTAQVYPLLSQHGLQVGKGLRVVSCDNEEARLAGLHPRPMSIDIGGEEIGFRAVNRLLNRIERPNGPPLVIQVAPRLAGLTADTPSI